jgi:glutamate--cysteine ligase
MIDGHLFGYTGSVQLRDGSSVGISISLEPGSQLEASVGPATSATTLTAALEVFDAQFAAITHEMSVNWELVAEGFNSHVCDPNSVPLIDKKRYHLMDAYLSQTGRYARDMMRCSTSTQVSVDLSCGTGFGGHKTYQLAVALGPILSFLTDNARSWRGLSYKDTPRMVRARIWEQVDPARCGTIPGTFSEDFGPESYADWLCGIRPILFTDQEGTTTSTGNETVADILSQRLLSRQELAHLLSMVFPDTRLKGFAEMRTTDSLPPQLAGSLAAFMKALFYCPEAHDRAVHLLVNTTDEASITDAWEALKSQGWDASVYGHPLTDIIDELMEVATQALQGDPDQVLLESLFSLWRSRQVPRDLNN